jgi:diaminopimelate epimerase
MKLRFTKMQGAGNDGISQRFDLDTAQLRRLADRHFGVGADQILLVEAARSPGTDFRYRIFNADGEEVEHCGNGARCFVRFVRERGLTEKTSVRVETLAGVLELREVGGGRVIVDMGRPSFEPIDLAFDPSGLSPQTLGSAAVWPVELDAGVRWVALVSMGNPHAVQWVEDVESFPVATEGPQIERHWRFARRVNAGFAQALSPDAIRLRVFERGAGETLACGTGACAAAVAGIRQGRLTSPVKVHTRGGLLEVEWDGRGSVWMTGPANTVFEGEIEL